ncbi:MAG: hypothetical protein ACE363_12765 [Alphaproteobacteria bacterium]
MEVIAYEAGEQQVVNRMVLIRQSGRTIDDAGDRPKTELNLCTGMAKS